LRALSTDNEVKSDLPLEQSQQDSVPENDIVAAFHEFGKTFAHLIRPIDMISFRRSDQALRSIREALAADEDSLRAMREEYAGASAGDRYRYSIRSRGRLGGSGHLNRSPCRTM